MVREYILEEAVMVLSPEKMKPFLGRGGGQCWGRRVSMEKTVRQEGLSASSAEAARVFVRTLGPGSVSHQIPWPRWPDGERNLALTLSKVGN